MLVASGSGGIYTIENQNLMRVKKKRPVPHFVSSRDFCRTLGLYHALADRLISLGVLKPDGYLDAKPIFSADLATVAQAKAAVAV